MSVEKKNLCPNCGAKLTGLELKCPECGYTMRRESAGSQSVTESLKDLQEKLLAVDKIYNTGFSSSKKKASIINAYPIPNTAESLVRLLHMSYSNFEAAKEAGDQKLSVAWLGKAVESYRRLSEIKDGLNLTDTLEKYKVLGDKKAFSKLSGSRAKKRRNTIIGLGIFAAIIAFILLFDWAGWLMRSGKTDQAIRFLKATGRTNEAVEKLIESELIEDAAELLFDDGQMVKAVSLLAQKGFIKEALIVTGKTNCADSIHACIDAIEENRILLDRAKYFLERNYSERKNGRDYFYNHDYLQTKKLMNADSTIIWEDCWNVNKYLIWPKMEEFVFSPFIDYYLSFAPFKLREKPHQIDSITSKVNGKTYITKISLEDIGRVHEFEYYYSYVSREKIIYKGIPTFELSYDYSDRGQLLAAHQRFLLTREERDKLFEGDNTVWIDESSQTTRYFYNDGRLDEIKTTLDKYDNRLQAHYEFEYFDNVVFRYKSLRKSGSMEMEKKNDVLVKYYLGTPVVDDGLVESFVINLDI